MKLFFPVRVHPSLDLNLRFDIYEFENSMVIINFALNPMKIYCEGYVTYRLTWDSRMRAVSGFSSQPFIIIFVFLQFSSLYCFYLANGKYTYITT
jgi:hypothetical protein